MKSIKYYNSDIEVQIGDHIVTKLWYFFTRTGRIIYIPDKSEKLVEFEHDDLMWVGVETESGAVIGELINSHTYNLGKEVVFIKRDHTEIKGLSEKLNKIKKMEAPDNFDSK